MDSPEVWRWIWLGVTVLAVLGELSTAGTFFLLPFGIGAGLATLAAFAGAGLAGQWLVFVAVTVAAVIATRPLARRMDIDSPSAGIGAKRLMGETAVVLQAIPAGVHECGLVRIGREEWRAESREGTPVPAGSFVRVVDVVGTRVVVWPTGEELPPAAPQE